MSTESEALALAREQIRLHELNRDGISGRREPAAVTLARALLAQHERAAPQDVTPCLGSNTPTGPAAAARHSSDDKNGGEPIITAEWLRAIERGDCTPTDGKVLAIAYRKLERELARAAIVAHEHYQPQIDDCIKEINALRSAQSAIGAPQSRSIPGDWDMGKVVRDLERWHLWCGSNQIYTGLRETTYKAARFIRESLSATVATKWVQMDKRTARARLRDSDATDYPYGNWIITEDEFGNFYALAGVPALPVAPTDSGTNP